MKQKMPSLPVAGSKSPAGDGRDSIVVMAVVELETMVRLGSPFRIIDSISPAAVGDRITRIPVTGTANAGRVRVRALVIRITVTRRTE